MNWLTKVFGFVPEPLRKPLWALLIATAAYVAARYGITIPPANNVIIVPEEGETFYAGKAQGRDFHPRLRPLLRAKLAVALSERDNIPLREAFAKVMSVDRDKLDTAVATAAAQQQLDVYGALGDGELLKKIIDFLNSPQGQALIKLLLMLLFAI